MKSLFEGGLQPRIHLFMSIVEKGEPALSIVAMQDQADRFGGFAVDQENPYLTIAFIRAIVAARTIRRVHMGVDKLESLQDAQAGLGELLFHLKQNFLIWAIDGGERIKSVHAKTLMKGWPVIHFKGLSSGLRRHLTRIDISENCLSTGPPDGAWLAG